MKKNLFLRWTPLTLILMALGLAFYFDAYSYLSFESLQHYSHRLINFSQQHYALSVLFFIIFYIAAVAISIPGAVFLTLLGGFLFGKILGTTYVVFSATAGATLLYLAVNTALGPWLEKRATSWVEIMKNDFKENAFNYLLTLRLIPVFPFWLINIIAAVLNVPLSTFVCATFIGIIPGSFIYVAVGSSLQYIIDSGQVPNLKIIFSMPVLLPLIGLGILSLAPVFYKHYKGLSDEKKT